MVRNLPVKAGDLGNVSLIPGPGGPPGGGKGNPFWYSCLENSTDGGAWWTTVHGVAKESDMTEPLSSCKKNLHVRDSKHSDPWALSSVTVSCVFSIYFFISFLEAESQTASQLELLDGRQDQQ